MARYCFVRTLAAAAVVASCAGSALAGAKALYTNIQTSPTSLIPGGGGLRFNTGTASQFDRPYVSPSGQYFIFTAISNSGATANDEVIVVGELGTGSVMSASLALREGVTEIEPGRTAEAASIGRNAAINDMGQFVFQANLSGGTTDDELIALGTVGGSGFTTPVREGRSVDAIAGAVFGATIDSPGIDMAGKVSVRSTLVGPPTGQTTAATLSNGGTLAFQTGVTVPTGQAGGGTATWQGATTDDFYIDANGANWLATGDTSAATTADGIVAVNNNVVLQEGQPVPGLSDPNGINSFQEAVMYAGGDWMARGQVAGTLNDWVVRNGSAVAMTGDSVPGGLPGETFSQALFAATFFAISSNSVGDYVYGGTTSNPDPEFDAVLVFNDSLVIARQGDPVDIDGNGQFDDNAFIDVFNNDDMFLTDDGYLYFFADLRDSASVTIGQAFLTLRVPTPGVLGLAALAGVAGLRRRR